MGYPTYLVITTLIVLFFQISITSLSVLEQQRSNLTKRKWFWLIYTVMSLTMFLSCYVLLVLANYRQVMYVCKTNVEIVMMLIVCIFTHITVLFRGLNWLTKHSPRESSSYIFLSRLCILFAAIWFFSADINYSLYAFNPARYIIPENLSFIEIAFEFLYYSFSLIITYSGNTILPVTIMSKTIEMLEILFFYTVVGIFVCNKISNQKATSL